MRIAVVDGQGGGIGKHLIERLRRELPEEVEILALGTNATAALIMLKAGANEAASGENAIIWNISRVDVVVGTLGIMIPNSMLGEITPRMAEAVASTKAVKILLPLLRGNIFLVGQQGEPLPHLIDELVQKVKQLIGPE